MNRITSAAAPPRPRPALALRLAAFAVRLGAGSLWTGPIVLHGGWMLLAAAKLLIDPYSMGPQSQAFLSLMALIGEHEGAPVGAAQGSSHIHVNGDHIVSAFGVVTSVLALVRAVLGRRPQRVTGGRLLGASAVSGVVAAIGLWFATSLPFGRNEVFETHMPLLAFAAVGLVVAFATAIAFAVEWLADLFDAFRAAPAS